jgi:membrane protein
VDVPRHLGLEFDARALVRAFLHAWRKHALVTHASAIAFRVLVSLVPLTLLTLGLLGAFGLGDVWRDTLAPALQDRVTAPVYRAVDYSVTEILRSSSVSLIVFASALLLWDMTWGVRAIIDALNAIHEVPERRPWTRRLPLAVGLAVSTGAALIASFLDVTLLPRIVHGPLKVAVTLGAWLLAVALLSLATGLLVRYAPAERPEVRWASTGSILVVATWIVTSAVFGWWAGTVADYKSATGSLTVFLVLTAYVLVSSAVFLVGVEVDELARRSQR